MFLLSLTQVIVEKVLFWGQIFEMETLIDLHVMMSYEFENQFLTFSLCVCYHHNTKTNYSRIFKFVILHLYASFVASYVDAI